jgi:lipid A 3-O-deacylase
VIQDRIFFIPTIKVTSIFIFFVIIYTFPSLSLASNESNPWMHTFYFENDLFNGTDSNYTNGVKYSIISPDLSPHATRGKLPRSVLELIHKIPFIAKSTPDYSHQVEFSIGQNMFTPGDITQSELVEDDRPYAGWTYLSTAYHRKCKADNKLLFMDTVELQIGIVGPESFGEDAQKLIHEIRDLTRPNGWDNQLDNELG